jgi:outer membrane lipoprotein LolB
VIRRIASTGWLLALVLALGACATAPRDSDLAGASWAGRLSVRVESDPVQSFSAGFDLQGNAQSGHLSLYSPLGSTVAKLTWTPQQATLLADAKDQRFDSLNALTRHAMGAELPIAGIFSWLAGKPASLDGWTIDLQDRAAGRLVARRANPAPGVEMRLILD